MIFNKLLPAQISEKWEEIRWGLLESVYPIEEPNSETMQDILFKLLSEQMQCWCALKKENGIYGFVITKIEGINKKELLIYLVYLNSKITTKEDYIEIDNSLVSFSKENGCRRIVSYSANPNAISLGEMLGYSSDYRFLIKEL